MRNRTAVIMFCGPLLESGHKETLRISSAIKLAADERAPLIIVGDENRRNEVEFYESMARERGLPVIQTIMAKSIRTFAYATAVAEELKASSPPVSQVFLVTDDWHMEHARVTLSHAFSQLSYSCSINEHTVRSSLKRAPEVLEANEAELSSFKLVNTTPAAHSRPVGSHGART